MEKTNPPEAPGDPVIYKRMLFGAAHVPQPEPGLLGEVISSRDPRLYVQRS